MKAHIDRTKSQLGELASLQAKTEQTERNILAAAESRLEEVQQLIERLRPGVEFASDPNKERYQQLIAERGQLNIVIARSREALRL